MTRKTRQRIDRIKIELETCNNPGIAIKALGNEFGISESRMAALLTIVYAEQEAERKKELEIMEQARKEEIIAWVKRTTVGEQEAEAYLSEIIRGVRKDEKVVHTQKGFEVVKLMPRSADVIKAISLYRESLPPKSYVLRNGRMMTGEEAATNTKEPAKGENEESKQNIRKKGNKI